MFLASVDDVRNRLAIDDAADINNAIMIALDDIESSLAAALNTSFARGQQTDVFNVDKSGSRQRWLQSTDFRLSNGFISGTPTLEVIWPFCSEPSWVPPWEFCTPDITKMTINAEKGVISDAVTRYESLKIAFTYTYGFDPDPSNSASYLLTEVPRWLQAAAAAQVLIYLAGNPILKRYGVSVDTAYQQTLYRNNLSFHLRYAPSALMPVQ